MKKSLIGLLILTLIHLSPAISQIEADPDLIVYYKFDGTAEDASANGFDATMVGSASYVNDRFNNPNSAFYFNGSSNYFLIENTSSIFKPTTFPITICAWVRIPSSFIGGQYTIFKNDHQENIYSGIRATVIPSGLITIGIENGGPIGAQSRNTKTGTTNIMDNQWHLITCIVRGFNDMDIYIDCNNDGGSYSGGGSTLYYSDSNPGIFGAYDGFLGNNGLNYSEGEIDDLFFISRELSFSEIASIYGMPNAEISGENFICPGSSITLTAQGGDSYLWSNGVTTQSIIVTEPGIYSAEITENSGCSINAEIEIEGAPLASWNPTSICESADEFNLNSLIVGTSGGSWSGSGVDENYFNPSGLTGQVAITYTVGNTICSDSQTNSIQVVSAPEAPIVLSDTSYCEDAAPPELTSIPEFAATIEWVQLNNPDLILSTNNTFIPPQNVSGFFGARQINNGCLSDYSFVEVEVLPRPESPIFDEDVIICSDILTESIEIQSSGSPLWFSNLELTNLVHEGLIYPSGMLSNDINEFFIITTVNGCSSTILEIPIVRQDSIEAQILGNEVINVCLPDEIFLQSSETTLNLWSTGETSQSISVNSAGVYVLSRTNSCNTVSDSVQIIDVSVDASFNMIIPEEAYLPVTVTLSDFESGCNWYLQGEPLFLDENNSFVVTEETAYSIEHHCDNDLGCSDKENKSFSIELPSEFYVPNAFTPNGDGDNDIFIPKGFKIDKLSMLIFNRWGELIFETYDANIGWDGSTKSKEIAPDGLYTCKIEAFDVYQNKYKHFGAVLLMK